jgi:prevent-host-death family protein
MTATEASRNFSAVLNRVQAGEEIEIVRNGAPVAKVVPLSGRKTWLTAAEWKAALEGLEPFDDDFAKDVEEGRRWVGAAVFEDPWEES